MTEEPKVQPLEMSLNYIWMLQPDYNGLRQSLDNKGYTRKNLLRGSIIIIAKKGTVEVFINPERRVLGIVSETSSKDLLTAAEDLEQSFLEIGMEPKNMLFIEFISSHIFKSTNSPLSKLNALKIENDLLPKLGNVLGKDIVTLGLNLSTKDSNPTESEWLSLVIEPLYPSANKSYVFRTVCRSIRKEGVIEFAKSIEKRIPTIVEKIEGR